MNAAQMWRKGVRAQYSREWRPAGPRRALVAVASPHNGRSVGRTAVRRALRARRPTLGARAETKAAPAAGQRRRPTTDDRRPTTPFTSDANASGPRSVAPARCRRQRPTLECPRRAVLAAGAHIDIHIHIRIDIHIQRALFVLARNSRRLPGNNNTPSAAERHQQRRAASSQNAAPVAWLRPRRPRAAQMRPECARHKHRRRKRATRSSDLARRALPVRRLRAPAPRLHYDSGAPLCVGGARRECRGAGVCLRSACCCWCWRRWRPPLGPPSSRRRISAGDVCWPARRSSTGRTGACAARSN